MKIYGSGDCIQMPNDNTVDMSTLFYQEGSSDKTYILEVECMAIGSSDVNFAYGRRGGALNVGRKATGVSLSEARRVFEKYKREKMAKGYWIGENRGRWRPAAPDVNAGRTSVADRKTAKPTPPPILFVPQLLNDVPDGQLESLLDDTVHCMQEKFDGRNQTLTIVNRVPAGYNKKGQVAGLAESVGFGISPCPFDLVLPGESMDDQHMAFDVLQHGKEDLRKKPYSQRLGVLMSLNSPSEMSPFSLDGSCIHVIDTWFKPSDKRREFERLKATGAEGVVFKRLDAPFTSGRPNSGGPQLRFKFKKTASFVVLKINQKRSVELGLFVSEENLPAMQLVSAGNVTIPANHDIPREGDVVETEYLYAFRESGSVYQPVYKGLRDDVDPQECLRSQLVYKGEGAAP